MPQELKIAMLGPSGVGKTSLLTAMYEQFEETIGQANLQLTPGLETTAILQERLSELKSLLNNFETNGGIQSNSTHRSFIFDLGNKGAKPSLRLNFIDFPGEYLSARAYIDDKEYLNHILRESVAVFIAIDTPALMEAEGKWHQLINRPQQITDLFKAVYQDIKRPRLVILAPVKCEKYVQDEKSASELLKRVKDEYVKLLNLFSCQALLPKVVSVVTPVQTVGNVVFSRIDVIDEQPHFHFRKISHDAEYCPRDTEQPLRYLLRFMLKLQFEDRNWNWSPFNPIRVWLGWDNHLKEAARLCAKGCKSVAGFSVIQGEKLLNIE